MKVNLKKGFTLVEVMVVVSIISFISSILSLNLAQARAKAQDTVRVADVRTLKTAVAAYKLDHDGSAPPMPSGVSVPITDSSPSFASTLAPLISGKYISSLPSGQGVFYFNAGKGTGNEDAVVIGTTLSTTPPSTSGAGGTCRPFNQGGNNIASNCTVNYGYITCAPQQNQNPNPPCNNSIPNNGSGNPLDQVAQEACLDQQYVQNYDSETPTQCNDGLDNDSDGKIDYPLDPGCSSINDNNETDVPAAYCSNSVANSDYCLCL